MKATFPFLLFILLLVSCATIPAESVTLSKALQTETERMHIINLNLLNNLFSAKRKALDHLIHEHYTATVINTIFEKNPTIDKKDFPELLASVTKKVIARRDSLVFALETEKQRVTDQLDADFRAYQDASGQLTLLLASSVKVSKERKALFEKVKTFSGNKIDFNEMENALDRFINTAGNAGEKITSLKNDLEKTLNKQ